MSSYLTIRQTAKKLDFPETRIRIMVKRGDSPGLSPGNRFLVKVGAFVEHLDAQSRRNSKVEAVTA